MLFEKEFYSISEGDIYKLIDYEVPEDRFLEYKQKMPGNLYKDIKEFLADISAFANASGGMMIFGLSEKNGVPVSIVGVNSDNVDDDILRLDNLVRSNIKPKLSQLNIRSISVDDNKKVVLVRVPVSWSGPHVVQYKDHWRFYLRTSAGKHPMDVDEVRSIMLQRSSHREKIKMFQDERLDEIYSGYYPVATRYESKIILHLIPFTSLSTIDKPNLNFNVVTENRSQIYPLNSTVYHSRHNLEGFLNIGQMYEGGSCSGYVQIFRNGIIETVDSRMLHFDSTPDEGKFVRSYPVEKEVIEKANIYFSYQKQMGVSPPISVFLSFLNIQGYYLGVKKGLDPWGDRRYIMQKQNLVLPELIIEDYPNNSAFALQPLFDIFWNAFGWERSYNYDEAGNWG